VAVPDDLQLRRSLPREFRLRSDREVKQALVKGTP